MARSRETEKADLRRKRQREQERDDQEALEKLKKAQKSGTLTQKQIDSASSGTGSVDPAILFETNLQQCQSLIEQVNSLYAQFLSGVELKPPKEARARLESQLAALQKSQKPTAAYQFRFNALQATFTSYRDRWEKQMKDFESGKIRPVAGPKIRRGGAF